MAIFEINFSTRSHCLRAVTPYRSIAERAVSADVAGRGWVWLSVGHKIGGMFEFLFPGSQTESQPDRRKPAAPCSPTPVGGAQPPASLSARDAGSAPCRIGRGRVVGRQRRKQRTDRPVRCGRAEGPEAAAAGARRVASAASGCTGGANVGEISTPSSPSAYREAVRPAGIPGTEDHSRQVLCVRLFPGFWWRYSAPRSSPVAAPLRSNLRGSSGGAGIDVMGRATGT
jgi:hypothetical protein